MALEQFKAIIKLDRHNDVHPSKKKRDSPIVKKADSPSKIKIDSPSKT